MTINEYSDFKYFPPLNTPIVIKRIGAEYDTKTVKITSIEEPPKANGTTSGMLRITEGDEAHKNGDPDSSFDVESKKVGFSRPGNKFSFKLWSYYYTYEAPMTGGRKRSKSTKRNKRSKRSKHTRKH
jgi:hypothetical protein